MTKFAWDLSYETGVETIDKQHKRLFEIINDLDEAIEAGKQKEVHAALFEELANYFTEHFGTEEKLMIKHEYPGMSEHLEKHNGFTEKVKEFHKKAVAGEEAVSAEVLQYLTNWLTDHIKAIDLKMGDYLIRKGER